MKASLATVAVTLSALAFAAPRASAQTPQMRAYHCIAISVTPGSSHATVYESQMIPMEANQQVALRGAWAAYIRSTYHLDTTASITCQGLSPNSSVAEQSLAAEENIWKAQGWEVVQVTWKPSQTATSASAASLYAAAPMPGGAAAPAAAAAAAAPVAGDKPSASYCFSDVRKPTIYFSDAFDTAGIPSSAPYSTAFTKFLAQKYKYAGTVTCKSSDTIMNALSMFRDQRDALQGKQIVETDWSYEAPAPNEATPAPTPTAAPAAPAAPHTSTAHQPTPAPTAAPTAATNTQHRITSTPAAAPDTSGLAYMYCSSQHGDPTVYFTEIFTADPGTGVVLNHDLTRKGPDNLVTIGNNFLAFLKQKYSFKSNGPYPVGCPSFGPGARGLQLAQDSKAQLQAQDRQAKSQIVETGWKNTP